MGKVPNFQELASPYMGGFMNSGKGVRVCNGGDVRFTIFLKYPMKMNSFGLT